MPSSIRSHGGGRVRVDPAAGCDLLPLWWPPPLGLVVAGMMRRVVLVDLGVDWLDGLVDRLGSLVHGFFFYFLIHFHK